MAYKRLSPAQKLRTLPTKYTVNVFAWDLDWRSPIGQRVMAELLTMADALGGWDALSPQKKKLVSRVTYLSLKCADYETADWEGKPKNMDAGTYSNHVNVLTGLLVKLGLERTQRTVSSRRERMAGSQELVPS